MALGLLPPTVAISENIYGIAMIVGTLKCLALLGALVPGSTDENVESLIMWDAQHFVIVRGTLNELKPNSDGTARVLVSERTDSGVGVSEQPGQRDIHVKVGSPFEQRFGFFWGGTSRPGEVPNRFPRFRLKVEGNGHCLVQDIPHEEPRGVTIVELGDVQLTETCEP
jgi:hypothetical protein